MENIFHNFSRDWFGAERQKNGDKNGRGKKVSAGAVNIERACATFELEPGFDRAKLRRRYMELAKKHHPDMNGGCKRSEELLKSINQAYTYLLNQVS